MASLATPDFHLNVNQSLSRTDDRLILQSLTGGTVVHVGHNQAIMQTSYYDEYMKPEKQPERSSYANEKLRSLLTKLSQAGAKFSSFGIISSSKVTLKDNDIGRNELLKMAQTALHLNKLLSDQSTCYDFTIRVSKEVESLFYSNMTLSWFQERQAALPIGIGGSQQVGPGGVSLSAIQLNEWDMELVDEGIEIKYDWNNKLGLLRKKLDWDDTALLGMAAKMLDALPSELNNVVSMIRGVSHQ